MYKRQDEDQNLSDKSIGEIVRASITMSREKTGALIVIEDAINLKENEKNGIYINADISSQLLINIFEHNTCLLYTSITDDSIECKDDMYRQLELFNGGSNMQIIHEIEYIIKHYRLYPETYIAYDRIAFSGIDDPELRITFDQNIRTRRDNLTLSAGDYGDLLLDEGLYLMEIKSNGAMPIWLVNALSDMHIYPYSFSKYGNDYKRRLQEAVAEEY